MVVLDNGILRVEIAEKGAEIRRATVGGEERLWNGDPEFWNGVAPVLFPICGGLRDDKFTLCGREYDIVKHGFARHMDFTLESSGETFAVFLLRETEETLKMYPWKFELRIKYTLVGGGVRVEYDVKNNSDSTMYTAIGAHEAYACPEGIEDYDVIFERKETLRAANVEGALLSREGKIVLKDGNVLPIYTKYFEVDALVFTDMKSRFVTLRNRKTGKETSVDFNGFDYMLLWTVPGAGYLCIEPWTSIPSYVDEGYEISAKEGMTAVEPNGHFTRTHTVYFK